MPKVDFGEEVLWEDDGLPIQQMMNHSVPANINPINPLTWPWPIRCGLGGMATAAAGVFIHFHFTKRPFYSNLFHNAAVLGAGFAIGYFPMKYREYNLITRDAIVKHYMELHPEAFSHLSRVDERKWKDVLLPWSPIRSEQRLPVTTPKKVE